MRTHQHTSLYRLTPASCGSDCLRSSIYKPNVDALPVAPRESTANGGQRRRLQDDAYNTPRTEKVADNLFQESLPRSTSPRRRGPSSRGAQ
jgi:hypothetical protein